MTIANLGADGLAGVLDFAERSLYVDDFGQVSSELLDGVVGVVGADTAKLLHLDLRTGDEAAVFAAASHPPLDVLRAYADAGRSHPLAAVLRGHVARDPRRSTLLRLSDVVAARRWRSTALHSATGLSDQLWLPLNVRGSVVQVVTVGRYGRAPFTNQQRDLLLACRAHLGAALGRATRGPQHRALQIRPELTWVSALDVPGAQAARPRGALSARERDVLALVAAGSTDAQVARALGLTTATVSKHLQRVYRRLDLPNRVAAVRYWEEETREVSRPGSSAGVTKR